MRDYRRYATGIIMLVVAVVIIVIGFNFVRNMFKNSPQKKQEETAKKIDLLDSAASGKAVRYTIYGNVVGEEEYRSIRITVDAGTRRAEVIQGYSGKVIKQVEAPNTADAYKAFVSAINGGGFTNVVDAKGRGIEAQSCALGRKFSYELAPGSQNSFRSWSTSCSRKLGTFNGNQGQIQTLFQNQVPDYQQFVSGVRLTR